MSPKKLKKIWKWIISRNDIEWQCDRLHALRRSQRRFAPRRQRSRRDAVDHRRTSRSRSYKLNRVSTKRVSWVTSAKKKNTFALCIASKLWRPMKKRSSEKRKISSERRRIVKELHAFLLFREEIFREDVHSSRIQRSVKGWSSKCARIRTSRGHHYILVVIDVLSKYVWAVPLKSKDGSEIVDAIAGIIRANGRCPKNQITNYGYRKGILQRRCTENLEKRRH